MIKKATRADHTNKVRCVTITAKASADPSTNDETLYDRRKVWPGQVKKGKVDKGKVDHRQKRGQRSACRGDRRPGDRPRLPYMASSAADLARRAMAGSEGLEWYR